MSSSETTPFRIDPFLQPFLPTSGNPNPNSPSGSARRRPLLLLFFVPAVVFICTLIFVGPSVIALWHVASGRNSLAERRDEEALRDFDKAVASNPSSINLRIERLKQESRLGQMEKAKADLEVIEKAIGDAKSLEQLQLRSQIRQMGGAYRKALEDQTALLALVQEAKVMPADEAMFLNNHAYSVGLAVEQEPMDALKDKELLTKALADCDRSLKLLPDQNSTLDTRGYIHGLLGDHEKALADINRSLELVLDNLQLAKTQVNGDPRQLSLKLALRDVEYGVAVLYQHRLKILQKSGNEEAAKKDRQAIIDLGYNPDVLLQ